LNGESSSSSPPAKKEALETKDSEIDLSSEIDAKTDVEAELQRFVKSAPPPVRSMMMGMMRLQQAGPLPHPIFEKFTADHIDKFLDYSHADDVNTYRLERFHGWSRLGYALLSAALLVFLILYLAPEHRDLLADILKMLAVFAGGFGAGFGAKTVFGNKN